VRRDVSQRLHYVTPVALVAPLLIGLAVLAQSGWSESSSLTWLALLFVIIAGPFLSHATIRAAQIRQTGDWRPWRGRAENAAQEPSSPGGTAQDRS
jgi:multisubunit Na+/H+ antiporter MnhG subunit